MTSTAPSVNPAGQRVGGRFASQTADLEELVTEVLSRIDEQLADHTATSRAILVEQGRDAVEDTAFARAIENVTWQVMHGSRVQQLDAVARLRKVHVRDEAAEDAFLAALLSALGVHNVDAYDLRRLVHRNGRAIAAGEPVQLDIPAELIARQQQERPA